MEWYHQSGRQGFLQAVDKSSAELFILLGVIEMCFNSGHISSSFFMYFPPLYSSPRPASFPGIPAKPYVLLSDPIRQSQFLIQIQMDSPI